MILKKIIAFFYPERCPYCNSVIEADQIACDRCMKILREKQQPIARGARGYRCIASFIYDGAVRRALINIKFREKIQFIPQMADILAQDIQSCYKGELFDLITAVPMHPKDQKKRGYNQSELLAKELSRMLGIPYVPTLIKVKHTKKQHHLKYTERRTNLSGAFSVIDKTRITGKKILIVDDIITSGVTLGTCCKTISRAKPDIICGAALANAQTTVSKDSVI